MMHSTTVLVFAALISLPLSAEAFVWKWLEPSERPLDSHPDLETNADRWYDYMRQSPPVRVYHIIRDAEEVGLGLKHFDLDQEPPVLYDGQGNRPEDSST